MSVFPTYSRSSGALRALRVAGAGLVLGLAVQLAGPGVPTFAAAPEFTVDELREAAAADVQGGGPSVKRAAEAALVGSEQDLRTYSETGFTQARTCRLRPDLRNTATTG